MSKSVSVQIKFKNYCDCFPEKGSKGAAGYDLTADEPGVIQPGCRLLVKTGISVKIPEGYYGRIAPRSGLAVKNGIDVLAGVIDSDYIGEIGVILYNTDKEHSFSFGKDHKIAQLIIEPYRDIQWDEVEELDGTERGAGGFGSTGN